MFLPRTLYSNNLAGSKIEKAVVNLGDWLNKWDFLLMHPISKLNQLTSQSHFWEFTGITFLRSVVSEPFHFIFIFKPALMLPYLLVLLFA